MVDVILSIIIPAYNVSSLVSRCLDSIISQQIKDLEILCVDDGSTDDTVDVIAQYCEKYDYIRLISCGGNHGQAYARNKGLEYAVGQYVYFVDADDYLSKASCINRLIESIADDSDGIYFDFSFEYENEKIEKEYGNRFHISQSFPEGRYSGIELMGRLMSEEEIWLSAWREIWSVQYLREKGICFREDTSPHEDLLFSFTAISRANRVQYIKEPIYTYCLRSGSSTAGTIDSKRHIAHLRCLIYGMQIWHSYGFNSGGNILIEYVCYIKKFMKPAMCVLLNKGVDVWNMQNISEWERSVLRLTYLEEYPHLKRIFLVDEYKRLRNSECIVIYGAGRVGHDIARLLANLSLDNVIFASTYGDERNGVMSLDHALDKKENKVIVLASSKRCDRTEMINALKERHVEGVIDLFSEVVK